MSKENRGSCYATDEQVRDAITALSEVQIARLRHSAEFRARGHVGLGADDLMQEAIFGTLDGTRHWPVAAVTFEGHLHATMRSLASHWVEKGERRPLVLRSDLRGSDPSGEATDDAIDMARSADPPPDAVADARRQVEEIKRLFEDDHVVLLIMDGLLEGMKRPEIQDALGIDAKAYDAAMKRLRRSARAWGGC